MVASLNAMAACDAPGATTCSITSSSIGSTVEHNFVKPLHQALAKLDSHEHISSTVSMKNNDNKSSSLVWSVSNGMKLVYKSTCTPILKNKIGIEPVINCEEPNISVTTPSSMHVTKLGVGFKIYDSKMNKYYSTKVVNLAASNKHKNVFVVNPMDTFILSAMMAIAEPSDHILFLINQEMQPSYSTTFGNAGYIFNKTKNVNEAIELNNKKAETYALDEYVASSKAAINFNLFYYSTIAIIAVIMAFLGLLISNKIKKAPKKPLEVK